mmetsp:Transcript_60927/g.197138  ORF Transcript_60927/g.197138 Transcript_60927/m.197138 type:complete len:210 (-) Transcript_60927:839-1468(-)
MGENTATVMSVLHAGGCSLHGALPGPATVVRAAGSEFPQGRSALHAAEEELLPHGVDGPGPGNAHPSQQCRTGNVQPVDDQAASHEDAAPESALAMDKDRLLALGHHVPAERQRSAEVRRRGGAAVLEGHVEVLDAVARELAGVVAALGHAALDHAVRAEHDADIALVQDGDPIDRADLVVRSHHPLVVVTDIQRESKPWILTFQVNTS